MKIRKHLRYLLVALMIAMMVPAPVSAHALTAKEIRTASEAAGLKEVGGRVFSTGATGWQTIGGKRYYFWPSDGNGHKKNQAATGWQTIGGKRYCFSDKGVQYIGRKTVDGAAYYFNKTGGMATGWKTIGGRKYYFWPSDGSGHKKYQMAHGLTRIGSKSYYFNKNGRLRTGGLINSGSNIYYAGSDGVLQKKWVTVGNSRYYFWAKSSDSHQAYRAARLPVLKNLRIMEANGLALEQKDEGAGTLVYMHRYEVIPEKLAEYQKLAIEEACRAVREEAGVMGMFVTAEHDAPNVIHIMEIYRDREGFENYQASKPCRDYLARVMPMFSKSHTVKNLPTKIVLTKKGKALAK